MPTGRVGVGAVGSSPGTDSGGARRIPPVLSTGSQGVSTLCEVPGRKLRTAPGLGGGGLGGKAGGGLGGGGFGANAPGGLAGGGFGAKAPGGLPGKAGGNAGGGLEPGGGTCADGAPGKVGIAGKVPAPGGGVMAAGGTYLPPSGCGYGGRLRSLLQCWHPARLRAMTSESRLKLLGKFMAQTSSHAQRSPYKCTGQGKETRRAQTQVDKRNL